MAKNTNKTDHKNNVGDHKNDRAIRVRMYRVGFGDCFLLSLPVGKNDSDQYQHFVIDCGVHGKGNIGTIERAVENIAEVTGKKIAAIIATHSHQDHISGFSKKFSEFEIGEVWLPWSENPKDELAVKWGKKQAALVAQLEQHFTAQAKLGTAESSVPSREKALAALVNLNSSDALMELLVNQFKGEDQVMLTAFASLTSNKNALALLKNGFNVGAQVHYFEAGNNLKDAAGVPGLEVRVLSPPRDESFLSKMDPPKDQRYLRMSFDGGISDSNKLVPFPAKWVVKYSQADQAPLNSEEESSLQNTLNDASLDGLAFALDSAKNNTSLVTLFIFKGQYLLFPGDAQYGNWKYWLDNEADEILPQITFLKVAHHGSHNAMPKDALEKMTTGKFAAMVSTQSTPWESIPRVPLMKRLYEQTEQKIVRSDWIKFAGAPDPLKDTEPLIPKTDPKGFVKGEFWYDCEIQIN
jgi:beta-lactamase superfamily II metal-dependent hydrolase